MLFRFFQTKVNLEIWLYDNVDAKIEGKITVINLFISVIIESLNKGFDEYMNLTLDDAYEMLFFSYIIFVLNKKK